MVRSVALRCWVSGVAALVLAFSWGRLDAGSVPPIVLVARDLGRAPDPAARPTAIESARAGKLQVREPSGVLRTLVDASAPGAPAITPIDVADPDVSFDGARIVFAGYSAAEKGWRIFEVNADGTGLRQLTRGDDRIVDLSRFGAAASILEAHDDVDPCYLPDGRICLVSTRYPGVAPDGRVRATNLHVMNADGSDLHRITTERFGADTPAVDPLTGRIVYSRWWRTAEVKADPTEKPQEPIPPGSPGYGDGTATESGEVVRRVEEAQFPGVNSWFLSGINPDGTDLAMFSGARLNRELTQAYRPSFLPNGEALALFIPRTPYIGYPGQTGLRLFHRGPSTPAFLAGPQQFAGATVDGRADPAGQVPPDLPPDQIFQMVPYIASAEPLPNGRILVSTAVDFQQPTDFELYTFEAALNLFHPLTSGTTAALLDAVPLVERARPPVVADRNHVRMRDDVPRTVEEALAEGGSFTFRVENIFANDAVDVAVANAPPIGHKLAIEFYMNPQRTSETAADKPILVDRQDVPADGRIETRLPAGVPLFEVLRLADNTIPLGRDGQIFHVAGANFGRAGEVASCVGCHAGHSQTAVPKTDVAWTNIAPSAFVAASTTAGVRDAAGGRAGVPPADGNDADGDGVPGGFAGLFGPVNLVDRSTIGPGAEWAAEPEPTAVVKMTWGSRIRAREVVIHAPRREGEVFGPRDQVIRGLTVSSFLAGAPVETVRLAEVVKPEGSRVPLHPDAELDALLISIALEDVSGLFEGMPGAALAEVEVIGQAAGEPLSQFVRGDVDCDAQVNLADAVIVLARLFMGVMSDRVCCEAAADMNGDLAVNLSDPIFELNFFFRGGAPLPPPFPGCGPAASGSLTCASSRCP